MYRDRVQAIKESNKAVLIAVPIIVSLLVMCIMLAGISSSIVVYVFGLSLRPNLVSLGNIMMYGLWLLLCIVFTVVASKVSLKDLGLVKQKVLQKIFIGVVAGFVAISLLAVLLNLFGAVDTKYVFEQKNLKILLAGVVLFILQSTTEEFIFRAYLMPSLSKGLNDFWSVMISSFLFMVVHLLNSGITFLAALNIFIAGVVFGLIYCNWANLWLNGFTHAFWNFTQGLIYGSLVSGMPLNGSVFTSTPVKDKAILSGAEFGFEGSIVTTVVGLLIVAALVIYNRKVVI